MCGPSSRRLFCLRRLSLPIFFFRIFSALFFSDIFSSHRHTHTHHEYGSSHSYFISLLSHCSIAHTMRLPFVFLVSTSKEFNFVRRSLQRRQVNEHNTNAKREKNLRRSVRWFSKCLRITRREDVCVCVWARVFHPNTQWIPSVTSLTEYESDGASRGC